jgi:hypothetical protein
MTEIIIRDGIVSSLTTQPTIAWDAIRNGDNPYGVFDGEYYLTWNAFSVDYNNYTNPTSYNLVSYFDENHNIQLPQYYNWKTAFYDIQSIAWPLYESSSNGFFKYNGDDISFYQVDSAIGAIMQISSNDVSTSFVNLFSFVKTISNSSNDSPSWFPIALDYDKQSSSPLIHRFHFRSGKQFSTITINGSSFDITQPHLFAIKCDATNISLYIDSQLITTLNAIDITSGQGWKSYNSAYPNSFIIGGYLGNQFPVPTTFAIKGLGVYAVFQYNSSYNHSEVFDLCKYRYNVPDVTYSPSVSTITLGATQIPIFGSTQFSNINYIEFI